MAVDGHLNFDTKFDSKAFETGVNKIESVLKQLLTELKSLNSTITGIPPIEIETDTSQIDEAVKKVEELSEQKTEVKVGTDTSQVDESAKKVENAAESAKQAVENIPDPQIDTSAAASELELLDQKIQILKQSLEKLSMPDELLFDSEGEYINANAALKDYKRLEKLDSVKAKIEELQAKKRELEKPATVTIDVNSDTAQITGTEDAVEQVGKSAEKTAKQASKAFRDASKNAGTAVDSSCDAILKMLSSTLGKIKTIAAAAGLAFGAREIITFGKEAVESAAEVKAANSQLGQTFGSLKENAEEAIKRVADTSGILETRLNSTATGIYAFAKTSGMESAQALSMMQDALQVAADSAAYYDRSLEDTSDTLKSFLKGNYANDAALGLSATEYTRNAAAMRLYGKSFQDLSEAQKQLTLLQMVKDANALSGAEGQAAREADGWENVLGNLKEAWRQLLAVVGQPVLQGATIVVQRLTEALTYLTGKARIAVAALSQLFGWEFGDTAAVADNISQSVTNQEALTDEVKETEKAERKSLAAFDQLNVLSSGDDSEKEHTSEAVTAPLSAAAQKITLDADVDLANSKIFRFLQRIRKGFSNLKSWIKKNFAPTFDSIWDGLVSESVELYGTMQRIFSDIRSLGGPLLDYYNGDFLTLLQTAFAVAGQIAIGLFDTFNLVFADIWDVAVFPILTDFITIGLPMLTEFYTEAVLTLGALFDEVKQIFDMLWVDAARPVLQFISKLWHDLMQSLKTFWDKWGAPIFEKLRTAIQKAGELFRKVWTTILKPIFDKLMAKVDEIWTGHMKPLLDHFLDFVGELINLGLDIYNHFIAPVVSWFVDKFGPPIVSIMSVVIDTVGSVVGNIMDAASHIIDYLKGIIMFIDGVFTGDWDKAWEGLMTSFESIWGAFADLVKIPLNQAIGFINLMISGVEESINDLIDKLNGINIKVPPALAKKLKIDSSLGFDFDNIDIPEIPYLAQGTVVPANYGSFLAVLGDNKREAEIVSPVSAMKQAMAEVLASNGGAGPKEIIVYTYLYPNSSAFRREIINVVNADTRNKGG